jgi:hypothetical protein
MDSSFRMTNENFQSLRVEPNKWVSAQGNIASLCQSRPRNVLSVDVVTFYHLCMPPLDDMCVSF